jgi:hypothetical protein
MSELIISEISYLKERINILNKENESLKLG